MTSDSKSVHWTLSMHHMRFKRIYLVFLYPPVVSSSFYAFYLRWKISQLHLHYRLRLINLFLAFLRNFLVSSWDWVNEFYLYLLVAKSSLICSFLPFRCLCALCQYQSKIRSLFEIKMTINYTKITFIGDMYCPFF